MIAKKCKYCGKEFISYKSNNRKFCSRKCHYQFSRKDKILKICQTCGKKFKVHQSKGNHKYCSERCYHKTQNHNFTKKCLFCGKIFHVTPSKKEKRIYCSKQCSGKSRRKRILKICKECEKRFEVILALKDSKFCSRICATKWRNKNSNFGFNKNNNYGHINKGRETPWTKTVENRLRHQVKWTGKNNPNWTNGKYPNPYTIEFNNDLKEQIRNIDNHICRLCGKTEQQELIDLNMKLSIHHIDYDKKNCKIGNLITLCKSCHAKTLSNRKYWITYFQAIVYERNLLNLTFVDNNTLKIH